MEPATNATANGTTSNTNNPPTAVSENYTEANPPTYDGIGMNGSSRRDAENNASGDNEAGTAPLLPTYSFAVAQPPPGRSTWRWMTGGTTSNTNSENVVDVVKHPRVHAIYSNKGWCLLPQVFFSFWVLIATARSLSISERMPSAIPMLGYILGCAAINLIPMVFFAREMKPLSPRNARLATWYPVGYAISSLAWIGAMVCVILVLIKSMPYEGDEGCRRGRSLGPAKLLEPDEMARVTLSGDGLVGTKKGGGIGEEGDTGEDEERQYWTP
ncbi:hypothetical protein V497_02318 [Pseudogymnoascus sp. VKM F-4516 (FW-969)]|nr:hypothetical protein V497_02318 [Pseudogymnoascus sp. VKM F-4516 (FW-969)]